MEVARSKHVALAVVTVLLVLALGVVVWWWTRHVPAPAPASASAAAPAVAVASSPARAGFAAIRGTVVRFASAEEARGVLAGDDDWVQQTGELQRALLSGRAPPVAREAFRAAQAEAALPWPADAQARWQRALERIAPALDRLRLPWPPELLLVHTSGRESADQPHTRGHAVVLPSRFEQQGFSDAEVLAHELWHVLSRYRPELATRLYALIGYEPVAELQWPLPWLPRRVANQDAPRLRHAMRLKIGGRDTWVMPVVLVASGEEARAPGATLLDLMEPRLLEVVPGSGGSLTQARLQRGQPVWHTIEATPSFLQRLGGNTDYTSHPDETIADNFMFLVSGRAVPNPALLGRIEAVLREPR